MSKAKTSLSKPAKDEEEAVKFLATLAARIAPALCLNDPKRAIEDAARLFECAREKLERGQEGAPLTRERAQLEADAERRDKYGFKLKGPNLSLADAFQLQKQERYWKGKRREGAYKRARDFFAALRRENLTWETFDGVEETTERALEELFERLREKRLAQDNASKKRGQEKNSSTVRIWPLTRPRNFSGT